MLVKNKTLLFWIVLLSCIYFVLRITSALTIHFFSDEADYIYFAFQAMTQKGMAFISLSEGVKPMHAWLMIPFLSFFHNNLLFGARFLSILTGFFTMIGLYLLSNELFKKTKIGLLSMAVFILFPYAQIYNSLAVIEGTVGMFMVFSLYLLIKLVKKPNALNALSFGMATGLGILTKRQAFFNLYLAALGLFFLQTPKKNVHKKLIRVFGFFVFSLIIVFLMQQILKISPYFERIAWFEGGDIFTKRAWIVLPLALKIAVFSKNLIYVSGFTLSYLTIPYLALLIYAVSFYKKFYREMIILLAFFVFPLLAIITFGRFVSERWMYPAFLFLIPIIALALKTLADDISKLIKDKLKLKMNFIWLVYLLFLIYPAIFIGMIIFAPLNSALTHTEKIQYFSCNLEVFKKDIPYFKKISKQSKIVIGTQNDLGFKNIMQINFAYDKNILINGYFPKAFELPSELITLSHSMPAFYAVFSEKPVTTTAKNVTLKPIAQIYSQNADCSTYRLYKIEAN